MVQKGYTPFYGGFLVRSHYRIRYIPFEPLVIFLYSFGHLLLVCKWSCIQKGFPRRPIANLKKKNSLVILK